MTPIRRMSETPRILPLCFQSWSREIQSLAQRPQNVHLTSISYDQPESTEHSPTIALEPPRPSIKTNPNDSRKNVQNSLRLRRHRQPRRLRHQIHPRRPRALQGIQTPRNHPQRQQARCPGPGRQGRRDSKGTYVSDAPNFFSEGAPFLSGVGGGNH